MTAQPVTFALPSRLFVSVAATAVLVLSVAGTVAFASLRIWNLATGSTTPLAAFHTTVVDSLAMIGLVLSLGLVYRLVRGPRALRRRLWVPYFVERRVRRLIELSAFGVAPLVGWDAGGPDKNLDNLLRPASEERVRSWLDGQAARSPRPIGGGDGKPAKPRLSSLGRARSTGVSVLDDTPAWDGPVNDHVVRRGDTFWSLAERIFGAGDRWSEIAGLNLGREVEDGVFFDSDMSLRRGWTIVVPRVDNPEADKPQGRRGLIR